MNNCFFISEGAFTFKVEGTGVITRGFFVSGGTCGVFNKFPDFFFFVQAFKIVIAS